MSRYNFVENDESYVVGWDNPLQCFFAQKFNHEEDDYVDVGEYDRIGEIPLEMTPTIIEGLQRDYDRRTEPTPLQKRMIEIIRQVIN